LTGEQNEPVAAWATNIAIHTDNTLFFLVNCLPYQSGEDLKGDKGFQQSECYRLSHLDGKYREETDSQTSWA